MKRFLTVIFSIFVLVNVSLCQELLLSSDSNTEMLYLNETIRLSLVLQSDLDGVVESDNYSVKSNNKFIYNFDIKLNKPGKRIIGPYHILYNGKELKSNTLLLNIVEKELSMNNIYIKGPEKAKKNEWVKFEVIYKGKKPFSIALKEDNYRIARVKDATFSAICKYENGVMIMESKYIIEVMFGISGQHIIDRSWFKSIPDSHKIINTSIIIE